MSGLNALQVLDSQIAELRASGDTGNVENLLWVRDEFAELIEAARNHLRAIRQMDDAMQDGINVQGAVSGVMGTKEMLCTALARCGSKQ